MERGNQWGTAEFKTLEQLMDAVAHLFGGLIREGDRQDVARPDAALSDDIGDAMSNYARLARARARQNQQRPVARTDCLALLFVELRKKIQDLSFAFEELHGALMFLGRLKRTKRTEVSALTRLWIFLAGVKTILTRLQSPDHPTVTLSPLRKVI